ncbi:MAG: polysaccharide deacetylase family protein [Bacteroidales bacterium]
MKIQILLFITAFLLIPGCSDREEPVPPKEGKILVLMYHRIVKGDAANLYERSVADLEEDLKYLKANNINVIDFNDLEVIAATGKMPFGNSAIITFDDGDHSWITLAKPLLLEYKMKATFFLWTYMMGHDSFITWSEVEQMSYYRDGRGERPFVFGSHTYSHAYLLDTKSGFSTSAEYNSFLDYELRESRKLIESHTPVETSILSLPYGNGAGDTDIISAAVRNGYKFIRTSRWGAIENAAVDLFSIPSLPILDSTTQSEIGDYLDL